MTNNLHHPRAGIKMVNLSPGLGYHQIQIIELKCLQIPFFQSAFFPVMFMLTELASGADSVKIGQKARLELVLFLVYFYFISCLFLPRIARTSTAASGRIHQFLVSKNNRTDFSALPTCLRWVHKQSDNTKELAQQCSLHKIKLFMQVNVLKQNSVHC